jgi:hypothetical protein
MTKLKYADNTFIKSKKRRKKRKTIKGGFGFRTTPIEEKPLNEIIETFNKLNSDKSKQIQEDINTEYQKDKQKFLDYLDDNVRVYSYLKKTTFEKNTKTINEFLDYLKKFFISILSNFLNKTLITEKEISSSGEAFLNNLKSDINKEERDLKIDTLYDYKKLNGEKPLYNSFRTEILKQSKVDNLINLTQDNVIILKRDYDNDKEETNEDIKKILTTPFTKHKDSLLKFENTQFKSNEILNWLQNNNYKDIKDFLQHEKMDINKDNVIIELEKKNKDVIDFVRTRTITDAVYIYLLCYESYTLYQKYKKIFNDAIKSNDILKTVSAPPESGVSRFGQFRSGVTRRLGQFRSGISTRMGQASRFFRRRPNTTVKN